VSGPAFNALSVVALLESTLKNLLQQPVKAQNSLYLSWKWLAERVTWVTRAIDSTALRSAKEIITGIRAAIKQKLGLRIIGLFVRAVLTRNFCASFAGSARSVAIKWPMYLSRLHRRRGAGAWRRA